MNQLPIIDISGLLQKGSENMFCLLSTKTRSIGKKILETLSLGAVVTYVLPVVVLSWLVWFVCKNTESSENLSAYGSIASAAGTFLATIWFTRSLHLQQQQIREQQLQFQHQFKHVEQSSKIEALKSAKEVLDWLEQDLQDKFSIKLTLFGFDKELADDLKYKSIFMTSTDALEVYKAVNTWVLKVIGPNIELTKGLKGAAVIYLQAIFAQNIDYTLPDEKFIEAYGDLFFDLPGFNKFKLIGKKAAEVAAQEMDKSAHAAKFLAERLKDLPLPPEKSQEIKIYLKNTRSDLIQVPKIIEYFENSIKI